MTTTIAHGCWHGTRVTRASYPRMRVRRSFLSADTSHWSSQGLRRECLLHIQGLHLHCGLLESCSAIPTPSLSPNPPQRCLLPPPPAFTTGPQLGHSLLFLLFLLVRARAFRYIRRTTAIAADDPTKRSTAARPRRDSSSFPPTFSSRFVPPSSQPSIFLSLCPPVTRAPASPRLLKIFNLRARLRRELRTRRDIVVSSSNYRASCNCLSSTASIFLSLFSSSFGRSEYISLITGNIFLN